MLANPPIAAKGESYMGTDENAAAYVNQERDAIILKLIKIDGIGEKIAEALYKIGIRSYPDLAEFLNQNTAEEISVTLKQHGVNRSPGLIDKDKMVRSIRKALSQQEQENPKLFKKQTESTKNSEERHNDRKIKDHDAAFTVLFDIVGDEDGNPILQTMVYDEKKLGNEEQFEGSDTSQWVNWMLERANLSVGLGQPESEIETIKAPHQTEVDNTLPSPLKEVFDAKIIFKSVRLSLVENSIQVPEKKLKAEIKILLSGAEAVDMTLQGLGFGVDISTEEIDTGTSALVASKDYSLEPHKLDYEYDLEFKMPAVGRYELHSIVRLSPSGQLMGSHRGPPIRIIP